jgi:hypothetical protein
MTRQDLFELAATAAHYGLDDLVDLAFDALDGNQTALEECLHYWLTRESGLLLA